MEKECVSCYKKYKKQIHAIVYATFLFTQLFLAAAQSAYSQNQPAKNIHFVRGRLLTPDRQPVSNATIEVKGKKLSITSNEKGEFSFREISPASVLLISCIGYEPIEIGVQGRNELLVEITPRALILEEAVVIGYGTSKRSKLTGSVITVKAKDIVNQPVTNPLLALHGRVSGLVMNTVSGNLGARVDIQIRGTNSLRGSSYSNPLYLIDGVPMPSTSINSSAVGGAAGGQSPFTYINPSEIASIEVLKDADATAIYGSRGTNGVILITTKRPKPGKLKISADFYKGFERIVNTLDLLDTRQYLQMRRDAFAADGVTPTATNAPDLLLWDSTAYTDWQKETMGQTAVVQNAQLDFSGGDKINQYAVSLGYRDNGGVLMGKNNSKRGSVRINLSHKSFDERFTFDIRANYTLSKQDMRATSSSTNNMLAPNLPRVDSLGNPYFFRTSTATNTSSPYKYLYCQTLYNAYNFISGGTITYKIISDLELKLDANYTRMDIQATESYYDKYYNQNANLPYKNETRFGTNYQETYNIEPQMNYKLDFANSKITALVGGTFQQTLKGGNLVYGRNFPSEKLMLDLYSASDVIKTSSSSTYTKYKYTSLFARLGYDYLDRYLFTATFRRDGSTRFSEDNRFGNFGAIAAGWLFSKESFVANNLRFLSYGKLRSSYGWTGNDQIADYVYMSTFAATNTYNGAAGLYADQIGLTNFSWETARKFEVALELGLLDNRILFNTAYYSNISDNQLISIPLASQTGWGSYTGNLDAKIKNSGVEIEISTDNMRQKDFRWQTNFNITFFKNKLLEYPGLEYSSYSNTYMIGKSINLLRRYEYLGLDKANGEPIIKNQDGQGMINSVDDYIYAGTTDNKYYGGIGNNFTWKNFELNIFFQFVKRPTVSGYLYNTNYWPVGNLYNVTKEQLENTWREPGDNAKYPRLSAATSGPYYNLYYNQYGYSTATIADGSFIRLKNIAVSYSLPKGLVERLKLSSVRFYYMAQNLFTITNYDGYDPETGSNVPALKASTFGINVTL
ncbi:MAG: SusC/RagA family TonB-linked outer membrane protein [Chitinophagaceae bacterium]|nr:SusC/RagA family TonB-linked outer membrane protein [Chitinophagaceae bacterium]